MSEIIAHTRRRAAMRLGIATVAIWAVYGLTLLGRAPTNDTHARMGLTVFENFADTRPAVKAIRFTMADESYTLRRSAKGWVMPESGGFPVRRDRIAELATDLETLRLDARRTNDPYKHAKIGLADPAEGGNGVLIEIIGPDDDIDTAMIAGRKAGRIYVRSPGDAQTYRTAGTLPPFYNRRSWLDFEIIDVEPAAISAIRLQDAAGDTLYLRRAPGETSRDFKPAPPYTDFRVIDPIAISSTALAITRLSPLDAKPAETLSSQPVARHISETFDGLEINLQAYREADGLWVTLRAVEAGEGARRAQAINEKAEGWAFRLRGFDWQDFTPAVSDIAAPVSPED